jgi:hypothetical protein
MDAAATLVWLASEPADAEQSRALSSWSRAHGVTLEPPRPSGAPALEVDPQVGDGVETWLERARDAIGAHDAEQAEAALAAAESTLRAHAELPQAAWLMAEVERTRALRWRRVPPVDAETAERAWMRAEALDGGRVAGVGEEASLEHPPPATIAIDLSPGDAEAWLDGEALGQAGAAAGVATAAGPHALVVTSAGAPVWAAWIDVPGGPSSVRVAAPTAAACSSEDMARVSVHGPADPFAGIDAIDASLVRCPAWVAATAGSVHGAVRMARCEAGRCGPVFEWRAVGLWSSSPSGAADAPARAWPAWATWAVAGGGAAIAAGVVVLAAGALQAAPAETRFVSGGLRSQ